MKIEEVLTIVDKYSQQRLNHVQELVLCASWQGYSYQECAKTHGYTPEYIKAVGYKLWHILSLAFQEPVTKNNLKSVLRRYSLAVLDPQVKSNQEPLILQSAILNKAAKPRFCWGEAVDVSVFYGRAQELRKLEEWIVEEHCRLVNVFGMGGIGKTTLSCKLAQQIQGEFDCIFWRSLLATPSLKDLLTELILFLSNQQENIEDLPDSIEGQISLLINYLRKSKCLIVLDNFEAILSGNNYAGDYHQGYEEYGELLRRVGELQHQSTLVITSQEKPREVELIEGERLLVRSLRLSGLKSIEIKGIFADKGHFNGSETEWNFIVEYYGGNPLILKTVASFIQDIFNSSFVDFVKLLKQNKLTLDDINRILDYQFKRLSDLEKSVMYWLAINQKPLSFQELQDCLLSSRDKQKLAEALKSLERRSLIEKNSTKFTQQPVVMQYVNEHFIDEVCQEITTEKIKLLISHSLIKGSLNSNQKHLVLQPIIEQVLSFYLSHQSLEYLKQTFLRLQEKFGDSSGYGVENLSILINQIKESLVDSRSSGFSLGQIKFEDWNLDQVNFTQINLVRSIFNQAFGVNPTEIKPKSRLAKTKENSLDADLWQFNQQLLSRGNQETIGAPVGLSLSEQMFYGNSKRRKNMTTFRWNNST